MGVKEIPRASILPRKRYMCFSHTHKGQSHNMTALQTFSDHECDLVDYELLTDNQGKRLVAFGRFAGYAGFINCLHGLGLQLLNRGYRTPFLNIAQSHMYVSLEAAKSSLRTAKAEISQNGLPSAIQPLLLVFTGNGNVSQGAQELAQELGVKFLQANEIPSGLHSDGQVYGCVLEAHDYCVNADGKPFSNEEYTSHPERFHSIFYEKIAHHTTALINGIYWEPKFPRLITKKDADNLLDNPENRLSTIADISCDISGSIEITDRPSTIADPFYYYPHHSSVNNDAQDLQIMAVDNLPAQLPRDATEYFGNCLVPILDGLLKGKQSALEIIKRATIVKSGKLSERHQWLSQVLSKPKRRVVIFGSGYVAGPVVKYFGSQADDLEIVIASNASVEAENLAKLAPKNATIERFDVADAEKLGRLVDASTLAISLLPASMHVPVAQVCLEKSKNLVTASYISPAMQELHGMAQSKGLLFLNEMGLDPGLDHLSAKKLIDEVGRQGKKITSFTSWCGGLPAPEAANNPLGYKFSWSPRAVLLAALNNARYVRYNQIIDIPGEQLLENVWNNPFPSRFNLEGIPNRDSTRYISLYGLEGIQTMLRGTLRYQGFCELMKGFRAMGLLSLDPLPKELQVMGSWGRVTSEIILPRLQQFNKQSKNRLFAAMEWLGIFSLEESFEGRAPTLLDAFCALLQRKLAFKEGEVDLVVMQHEFTITDSGNQGKTEYISSSLIEYGLQDCGGFSAMARTVGYPVAMAAEMILNGELKGINGVQAPLHPRIYNPLLERLERVAGIKFVEQHSLFPPSETCK